MSPTAADLLAVFDSWTAAGNNFTKARDVLADGTNRLCGQLTAAGAAWGQDQIGGAFFNGGDGKPGFGAMRDQVLPQIADMVNVLGGTGAALVAAGATYKEAEQASTIRAPAPGSVKVKPSPVYHLPPYTGGMAVSDPPPGELMQILHLVESLVLGCEWPDGSLGGLAEIRDALSAEATVIGQVITDVHRAASEVTGSNAGQGTQNFTKIADQVLKGLGQLEQACQGLASSTDNLIRLKKAARIQFIASLIFLLASFIAAQALALFTFGASEPAFEATAEIEAQALRVFLRGIVRAVIEGMWYSGGMDAIGQLSKMDTGAQHGFKAGEFFTSVGEGAVFGLVMGGLGGGVKFGAIRGSATMMAVTGILETEGIRGTAARLVFSSLTGTAGGVVSQAVITQHVDWTQAAQFGTGMAILGEAGEHGKHAMAGTVGWVHTTFHSGSADFSAAGADDAAPGGTLSTALDTTLHPTSSTDLSAVGDPASQTAAPPGPAPADTGHPDATASPSATSNTSPSAGGQPGTHLASVTAEAPAAATPAADPLAAGGTPGQHLASVPGPTHSSAVFTEPAGASFGMTDHVSTGLADATSTGTPAVAAPGGNALHPADTTGDPPTPPAQDLTAAAQPAAVPDTSTAQVGPDPRVGTAQSPDPVISSADNLAAADQRPAPDAANPADGQPAADGGSQQVNRIGQALNGHGRAPDERVHGSGADAASQGQSGDTAAHALDFPPAHTDAGVRADHDVDAAGEAAADHLIVVRRHARAHIETHRAGEGRPDRRDETVPDTTPAGRSNPLHEPVKVTKVVEIDGDRPPIPRIHSGRFGYGLARDVFGDPLPVRDGVLRSDQVGQGAIGVCGRLSSLRASIDYVARYRPEALDDMIMEKPDGTVAVRFYDVKVYENGVAVPTGLVYEVLMGREVPVLTGRGEGPSLQAYARNLNLPIFAEGLDRPAYAKRSAGVLWPMLWEKGAAALTYHWTPERAALHALLRPKYAHLSGFELLNKGTQPYEHAEMIAQITGEPAYVITSKTGEEVVATWKELASEGRPAVIGLRAPDNGERNEYFTLGPHAYDVVSVVHGTAEEAVREQAKFETADAYARITDYGKLGSDWRKPGDAGSPAAPGSGRVHELTAGSPDAVQAEKDKLVTDRVIMRNPHNVRNPKPVRAADVDKVILSLHTATVAPAGKFDYLMNTDVRVDHPELPAGHGGEYAYAELTTVPLYDGIPSARQVIPGDHLADNDVLVALGAVARTHPDLIQGMLTQQMDGRDAGVTMVVHEDEYDGPFVLRATGRTYELRMTPDLPVDPVAGHTVFANAEAAGASWAAFLEKGFAGLSEVKQKVWSPDRIAADAGLDVTGSTSLRGYPALASGPVLNKMAEVLTQITGQKTQILAATKPETLLPYLADITSRFQVFFRTVDFSTAMPDGVPTHGLRSLTAYEVAGVQDGHILLLDGDQVRQMPGDEVPKLLADRYLTLQWQAPPK